MNRRKHIVCWTGAALLLAALALMGYRHWLAPTHILIVNPLPAQAADIALTNDNKHIRVTCLKAEELKGVSGYDAVMMFGRSLFLDDRQTAEMERLASKGVPIFTYTLRHFSFAMNRNLTAGQQDTLQAYFQNPCRQNYRNALRYMRHIATPHRWGEQTCAPVMELPRNLFYHREYGKYFQTSEELTNYLKEKKLYHEEGARIAFISGITFPTEGNRAHVDSLITGLTQAGHNVYPLIGDGQGRERLLKELHSDAIVYLPMGRLGSDSLITWLHEENIPLFTPFPLIQSHTEWLDVNKPVSGGTLTARVVVPEVDGGMAPLCIATQNENGEGYYLYTAEPERMNAFLEHVNRYLTLRKTANNRKRVAICYFKNPGKDALQASGMEVVPSLYNFLKRLQAEGYDVSGLPATLELFKEQIARHGAVLGSYAHGAQEEFLNTGQPVWLQSALYEQWAQEVLLPEKYQEVTARYGNAPGQLLARGDSLAVACLQYGNVLLFPQPRPALGEDEFKLVHGMPVAPPHSYLAPYLYILKGFGADALIHFGTHGNLEFTPGKSVGLSQADWADVLVGNLPHFYFYTTGNVGESIIAKRRTHAVLVTYLTPPYVESGMRQKFASLLADIHKALDGNPDRTLGMRIKQEVIRLGLHRDLQLDSIPDRLYTAEELERLDVHAEEIANEKMQGAYYTLGEPYSDRDLLTTTLAIAADPLAYETARSDRDKGKITTGQLQDFNYVAHHYLPEAKRRLTNLMQHPPQDTSIVAPELLPALRYMKLLKESPVRETDAMIRALNGGTVLPAPGGDPVLNPNVLPTGRNMYSINAETTPAQRAWEDGKRLAEATLQQYVERHGEYPRKVSYTFWAGEFINTEGATIAQALWMMGVEPVRDGQGRVIDLRLVPDKELGRPRINVLVQVSGQLRDITGSRLKLLTEAVRLASAAGEEEYPNYVASGTHLQEKLLVEKGTSPKRAREMSVMRVFGPVNSGYSTGIMGYAENSGSWEDENEIAQGYLNNMGAAYGDEENWGAFEKELFATALSETDVIIQPRQSNTWGPISLDHVYEFTGALSLATKMVTGKEPDAYMADYRNRNNRRMQEAREAIAVETRTTILNPVYVQERMKGDTGTAQMFGKIFRNIFGWHVMRPSAMDKELFNDLYKMYIQDENKLGIYDYFKRTNPAAFQTMTSVMLESARKGYWKASDEQLKHTAAIHAQMIREKEAACTEFVCNNEPLQAFITRQLGDAERKTYTQKMEQMRQVTSDTGKEIVLKGESYTDIPRTHKQTINGMAVGGIILLLLVGLIIWLKRRKR